MGEGRELRLGVRDAGFPIPELTGGGLRPVLAGAIASPLRFNDDRPRPPDFFDGTVLRRLSVPSADDEALEVCAGLDPREVEVETFRRNES